MHRVLFEVNYIGSIHGFVNIIVAFGICLLLYFRAKTEAKTGRTELERNMLRISAGIALFVAILFIIITIKRYADIILQYKNGHYVEIEGVVEDYILNRARGPVETFTVDGVKFVCSDGASWGYRPNRNGGNAITGNGQYVRIRYIPGKQENTIVYIAQLLPENVHSPSYQVPLEEIAERIEYEYVYENSIDYIAGYDYKQLSFLPSGEDIAISIYAVEGNKLLFLPEEKANAEVMINNEPCRLHYSKEADGYVFYVLVDWQLSEDGIPVNSLEDDYYHRIRECIVRDKDAVYEEVDLWDSPVFFMYEFVLDDMVKLGDAKVTFDPKERVALQKISVNGNEYIDAAREYAADILREKQKYGNYRIYLETYGRVPGKYGEYTEGKISASVIGEEMEEYFFFTINDGVGRITKDSVWDEYYPSTVNSPTCFTAQWYLDGEPDGFVRGIVSLQREEILMKVREEKDSEETDRELYTLPEYNPEIDFRTMDPEETAEQIRYAYSYGEWFGMNELGCQTGELRGFQDEEIIMYSWENNGDAVYFVPQSKVNTYVKCGNKENCPLYVNKDGKMEFYLLKRNGYAGVKGQMKTSFFMEECLSTKYAEAMIWLGESKLTLRELPSLDVAKIEEDEYISALKEYIEDVLQQNGRGEVYEMSIGEYEALHTNKVCLSAAVCGEEESYYFRYMIVKSENGNFYFWPAGFGLDSSLSECEAGKHYMNALCIERTRQLSRTKILLNENTIKVGNYYQDYNDLEKNHTILSYDICTSPRYDYENTPLAEYIEETITENEEMSRRAGKEISLEIDYHLFDFNGDGIEDYLLCTSGPLFVGNGGNDVEIYIREGEGVREVLSTLMFLHNEPHNHESFIVLDEKTDDCYAIVPPGRDFILRYNKGSGWYDWPESEESILDIEESQNKSATEMGNEGTNLQQEQSELQSYDGNTIRNHNYFVDLENLEEYHNILSYDICSSPRYDYENTPLVEYVEEIMEGIEEESGEVGKSLPVEIEYHLFDFNDDGKEDYLLCVYGTSLGLDDEAAIFIQEEEGIRRVLYIDMPLCTRSGESLHHSKLIVIDEKTNGYYGIAPEYGNYILRYDAEQGRYDFGVRE